MYIPLSFRSNASTGLTTTKRLLFSTDDEEPRRNQERRYRASRLTTNDCSLNWEELGDVFSIFLSLVLGFSLSLSSSL
jgi:hypothetical protein